MRIRTVVRVLALLTLAGPSYAQSVGGGFKIGVNFANASLDPEEGGETKVKTGLVVGGFVDVGIDDRVSFQPEFLYTQKGLKLTDPELEGGTVEAKVSLDMIQIPTLIKLNFGADGAAARGFIVVGPGFGLRTRAKIEIEELGEEEDIKDDITSVEVSGIIGAGVQFGRGMVEVRYDHGFTDLDEDDSSKAKSRTFSILFGIGFGR